MTIISPTRHSAPDNHFPHSSKQHLKMHDITAAKQETRTTRDFLNTQPPYPMAQVRKNLPRHLTPTRTSNSASSRRYRRKVFPFGKRTKTGYSSPTHLGAIPLKIEMLDGGLLCELMTRQGSMSPSGLIFLSICFSLFSVSRMMSRGPRRAGLTAFSRKCQEVHLTRQMCKFCFRHS